MRLPLADVSGLYLEINRTEIAADDADRHVIVSVQTGLTVNADPQLVRIALQNLLENAWKFTRGTAHPRVDVLRDQRRFHVHVGTRRAEGQ